jgi:radical SAM-linked protein
MPVAHHERPQPAVHRRYRFTFSKTGDARFLSHRQVMDAFERVLRAASLPVHYTEGFNPHIRLSMGPALALGHEGAAEIFDVDCTAPITPAHRDRANSLLPDGVKILDAQPLMPGAPSLGRMLDAIAYRIAPPVNGDGWPGSAEALDAGLREAVQRWELLDDGSLRVEINARQEAGPTASVKKLLVGLGLNEDQAARTRAIRERLVLRPKRTPATEEPAVLGAVSR